MANRKSGAYLLLGMALVKIVVNAVFLAAFLALLALFALQFPHAAKLDSLWLTQMLRQWGDPALAAIALNFHWAWPSQTLSYLPIGVGFAVVAVKIVLDVSMSKFSRFLKKRLPLPEETMELSTSASSKGIEVSNTLLALAAVSEKARAKLERRYARVQQQLERAEQRRCAFLSIGVVDAEDMKRGAAPDKVERSFKAYENMLDEIFKLTGVWKVAWTPENVMVCYLDVHQALDAAQRVLKGIANFNARSNELSSPFRVCCGINEGEVAIYEDSKLQKVADRVIDVAGHMQKHARPNSLWLSSEVYEHLQAKPGFHPAEEQVDGYAVQEWAA